MALTLEQHEQLEILAAQILEGYTFVGCPVPVEDILSTPPLGLAGVDISDLSLVFGTGEHQYDYRLALSRLLYREILRDERIGEGLPGTSEAAAYFSMALLLPRAVIRTATEEQGITLEALSERYQVSRDTMTNRLKQIGAALPPTQA